MNTIFVTLRNEHDEHRALMAQVAETTGDSEDRRNLFKQLARELRSHAAAEERCFYAPILSIDMTTEKSRHSIAEHQEMDELIKDLESRDMSDANWIQKFSELRERTEHHMSEEEHEVFQMAGKVLSDQEKTDLAEMYLKEKDIEMAQHA